MSKRGWLPSAFLLSIGANWGWAGGLESRKDIPIVRVVVEGRPRTADAAAMLLEALTRWGPLPRARFMITPGGFMRVPFPDSWSGRSGWRSRPEDLKPLRDAARSAVQDLLTPQLLGLLRERADYLTIGVDVASEKGMESPHAELVAVVDLRAGMIVHWTGKSYPLPTQEKTLVEETDLESHLFTTRQGERTLILGCHDLNMFNPRTIANQSPAGPRRRRSESMIALAQGFHPVFVLQHPHGTDTPNIWRLGWVGVRRSLPGVKAWASGIGYFNFMGGGPRAPLGKVLEETESGPEEVADIIIGDREN